jgi:hypothetical protein
MLTVERSPGAAVVIAPGLPPLPLVALAPLVSTMTPFALVVAVPKAKGLPPRLRVAVAELSAPRTPWSAYMIEIRISTFVGRAIFAVTSSYMTLRRKLGEEEVQERWKTNDDEVSGCVAQEGGANHFEGRQSLVLNLMLFL